MIGHALAVGVRAAARRPALVALLWAWNLALASIVALPFLQWVSRVSASSPVADRMLDGFDVAVMVQFAQSDPSALPTLIWMAASLVLLSLVSGAFLSGGLLEVVLGDGDERPFLHRFFRGAGHFFGRFLRLLALAGLTTIVVVGLVAAALSAATRPLANSGSEPAALWGTIVVAAGVVLGIAFFGLAHDYARAMTVIHGTRGMLRTWLRAVTFVLRHLPAVALIAVAAALGAAITVLAPMLYDGAFSARSVSAIVGAIVVYQAMALLRIATRVGQVAAQASYCSMALPAPPILAAGPPAIDEGDRGGLMPGDVDSADPLTQTVQADVGTRVPTRDQQGGTE